MNKIYSKVWNRALRRLVVASELAKMKGSGMSVTTRAVAGLVVSVSAVLGAPSASAQEANKALESDSVADGKVVLVSNKQLQSGQATSDHLFDANGATDGSEDASATGTHAVAAGADATASGSNATAVGYGAAASGANGVALGYKALAAGAQSVAVGTQAKVIGAYSMAFGYNAIVAAPDASGALTAPVLGGIAMGVGAQAKGTADIVIGYYAVSRGPDTKNPDPVTGAIPQDEYNVVIGSGAQSYYGASRSVVVGVGAGSAQAQRSGVNVNQLTAQTQQAIQTAQSYTDASSRQAVQSANAYTDQQIQGVRSQMNDQFKQQGKRIDQTGAMGAAMTQMAVNTAGLKTDNRVGAGIGGQGTQTALSVGYQRVLNRDGSATLSAGGSVSNGGNASFGIGAGFGW